MKILWAAGDTLRGIQSDAQGAHAGLRNFVRCGTFAGMSSHHPDEFLDQLRGLPTGKRHIVAIAGPPGAGKSTLVEGLSHALNADQPGRSAILAMDGYHFDDRVLRSRGRLAQKGAPDTYDVGGLNAMIKRLRANTEDAIAVPVFDRAIETARAGADLIPQSAEIILVEGNYVLLKQPPWDSLADLFDLTALIRVDEVTLRKRLTQRWLDHGFDSSAAADKVNANDFPNGVTVLRESRVASIEIDGTKRLHTSKD